MDRKELRKQVTKNTTSETQDEISKAWKKFTAIALVVLGVAVLILAVVLFIRGTAEVKEPPVVLEAPPIAMEEFSRMALEAAQGYSAATTVLEKANHVMDPRRVMPLMEGYYAERPMEKREAKSLSNERYHVSDKREFLMVNVVFDNGEAEPWIFELNEEQKAKIQWEVVVGYSDKEWDTFVESKDTESGTFRVTLEFLVTNPYYSYDFEDSDEHSCFMIRHPKSERYVYGYLRTDSEAHKSFNAVRIMSNLRSLPSIVTMRFLEDGQPDQVLMENIESFSWISGVDM